MLTSENRKRILNQFLINIAGIADKDYQKRIWIRGEGPECDDFDEVCCEFFPTCEDILQNHKDFWITDNQWIILINFYAYFRVFSDENNWPERFIETAEWGQIIQMAKRVLEEFNFQGENEPGK